jgi:hypothetical protein
MLDALKRLFAPAPSLEAQLQALAGCGIRLAEGRSVEDLLRLGSRAAFEKQPFIHLLCVLGDEGGDEDGASPAYLSDDIWHFDTECIEDHGDYARIIRRMCELSKGALPLQDIRDHVDVEAGQAWVSFTLGGQTYRWTAEVDDDWVDAQILTRLAQLLDAQGQARRFISMGLFGQDMLLGCASADELAQLKRLVGPGVSYLA